MILAPPPDLVVTSLEIINNRSVRTGDTLHARYVVTNEGAGPSFESYWTDYIVSVAVTGRKQKLVQWKIQELI